MWDLNSNQAMQIAQVGWEPPDELHGSKIEPELSYTCQNVSSQHDGPIKSIHWIKAPNYSCIMTGSWDKTLKVSPQHTLSLYLYTMLGNIFNVLHSQVHPIEVVIDEIWFTCEDAKIMWLVYILTGRNLCSHIFDMKVQHLVCWLILCLFSQMFSVVG